MRPKRYPYSRKKESAFVKADNELILNINKIDIGNIQAKNIFGKIWGMGDKYDRRRNNWIIGILNDRLLERVFSWVS